MACGASNRSTRSPPGDSNSITEEGRRVFEHHHRVRGLEWPASERQRATLTSNVPNYPGKRGCQGRSTGELERTSAALSLVDAVQAGRRTAPGEQPPPLIHPVQVELRLER